MYWQFECGVVYMCIDSMFCGFQYWPGKGMKCTARVLHLID